MSKVIRLIAENFKRIRAIRIEPDQTVCKVTGRNGAGKTSVLDSIAAALMGARAVPEMPVRKGARKASVEVDLGHLGVPELKVRRTFTANGGGTLTVTDASGNEMSSPQAVLDKLVGALCFDPMAFLRMVPKQQAEVLKRLAGLDFTQMDLDRQFAYEARQRVNREARSLKERYDALPIPGREVPDEEVDASELSERLAETSRAAERFDSYKRDYLRAADRVGTALARLEQAKSAYQLAVEEVDDAKAKLDACPEPDGAVSPQAIREQMTKLTMLNKAVRDKKEWKRLGREMTAKQDEADGLTRQIEQIDEWKAEKVREAGMPVEGLEVTDDGVTFHGTPLAQCASSEQIRIGLAMGEAMNPKLRVVIVRDGSLLDPEGFKEVVAWADENDMQVFVETVASTDSPTGVVVEDGEVVADTPLFELELKG